MHGAVPTSTAARLAAVLVDDFYDKVKGAWEERFERTYGFWRGFVDGVVPYQTAGFVELRAR